MFLVLNKMGLSIAADNTSAPFHQSLVKNEVWGHATSWDPLHSTPLTGRAIISHSAKAIF